jgi:hypothetical protein
MTASSVIRLYVNRGKELPDPAKLLQGSGNQARSIHLEGASTLARAEVVRLIDEAIVRNRVPFALAAAGRWSFVRHRPSSVGAPHNMRLAAEMPWGGRQFLICERAKIPSPAV